MTKIYIYSWEGKTCPLCETPVSVLLLITYHEYLLYELLQPGGPRLLAKHPRRGNGPNGGGKLVQGGRSGGGGGRGGGRSGGGSGVTRGLLISGFICNPLDAGSASFSL